MVTDEEVVRDRDLFLVFSVDVVKRVATRISLKSGHHADPSPSGQQAQTG